MIIKEYGMGWIIEPVTSDEGQALEKIIEGLRRQFPKINTEAFDQANHSHPLDHSHTTDVSG